MIVDWNAVATISAPAITLIGGVCATRWFENRPTLISYFGHVATFRIQSSEQESSLVYTHSVILRNTGRKKATNVRLRHHTLPDFMIQPDLDHQVETLTTGVKEIVLPVLVPGEQITISYLYFPPLTAAQINNGIRSDEGFARSIPVLLTRQYSQWFNIMAAILMLVGIVTVLYLSWELARSVIRA